MLETVRLWLLPSSPDQVHGGPSRGSSPARVHPSESTYLSNPLRRGHTRLSQAFAPFPTIPYPNPPTSH